MNKICEFCQKPYSVIPAKVERSRYCSRPCAQAAIAKNRTEKAVKFRRCPVCDTVYQTTNHHGGKSTCSKVTCVNAYKTRQFRNRPINKVQATCANCSKPLYLFPSRVDGREHFCNHQCKSEWRKKQAAVTLLCGICQTPYTVNRSQIELRGSKYCSKECQSAAKSFSMIGDGNPNYKGGDCGPDPYGPHWTRIAKRIRKRDNHTCQSCGKQQRGLHVHHIVPRREFVNVSDANRPENLISLCKVCHIRVHLNKIPCPIRLPQTGDSMPLSLINSPGNAQMATMTNSN